MKCPKCGQEVRENAKFCSSCGVNLEEALREEEEKKRLEEVARKAEEERKAKEEAERLEREKVEAEARAKAEAERIEKEKAEAEARAKAEAERIEKEKAEAEAKAKEEAEKKKAVEEENKRLQEIREAEIKKAEEERRIAEEEIKKRKAAEEEAKNKEEKPKETPQKEEVKKEYKPKKKRGFFSRLFGTLILIIVLFAAIVGGVYYLHTQEKLPEEVSDEIDDLIEKFNIVKDDFLDKIDNKKDDDEEEEDKIDWKVEPEIEADDIIELDDKVSIIKLDGSYGLVNNKTGKIVLDPDYDEILYTTIYKVSDVSVNSKKSIVIKKGNKYYSVDSKYQKDDEVKISETKDEKVIYYYDHYDEVVYEGVNEFSKFIPSSSKIKDESNLKVCTNLNIITTDGKEARSDDLTKGKFKIDMKKSDIYDKGYFDLNTGKLIINCDYEDAYDFSEGYAAVKKEGKAGFIDGDGKTVVDFKFDETRSVHDGLAWAKKDGKWGLIEVK